MVEDPVRRQRYGFRPLEDGGVELDLEVDPGGDVPPHLHPRRENTVVLSPPPALQPLLLGPFARMAERRGLE